MKAVILAGGLGTRISEETHTRPKPMVEIGGRPLLWHIMKIYSSYGINEFVVCLGYKGYVVKEYFANYELHMSDVTFKIGSGSRKTHRNDSEPWTITLIDTGENTATAGRLGRVASHVSDEERFCLTYGDGVANVNLKTLIDHHDASGLDATITAVQPPGRYGALRISEGKVAGFIEKPSGDQAWINGGFFVMSPRILDLIDGDDASLESDVLPLLANKGTLGAFKHSGFWQPMDTLREKNHLEQLWESGEPPWRVWEK